MEYVRVKEFLDLRKNIEPSPKVWELFAELLRAESNSDTIIPKSMEVPGLSEAICQYDPLSSKVKAWVDEALPENRKEGDPLPPFPTARILARIFNLLGKNAYRNLCLGWVISEIEKPKEPKKGEKFRLDPSKEMPATLAIDLWAKDKGVPIRNEIFYVGFLWDASMRYFERKGVCKMATKNQAQFLADLIKDLDKEKTAITNKANRKMGARWAEAMALRALGRLWLLAWSEKNPKLNFEAFEKNLAQRKNKYSPMMTAWLERSNFDLSVDEIAYLAARSIPLSGDLAIALRFLREEGGAYFKEGTLERETIDALR